jgi:hypothetical protein
MLGGLSEHPFRKSVGVHYLGFLIWMASFGAGGIILESSAIAVMILVNDSEFNYIAGSIMHTHQRLLRESLVLSACF